MDAMKMNNIAFDKWVEVLNAEGTDAMYIVYPQPIGYSAYQTFESWPSRNFNGGVQSFLGT
jgi:hypothetical protein